MIVTLNGMLWKGERTMLTNYSQKGLAYHVRIPFKSLRHWIENKGLPVRPDGRINIHVFDAWLSQNIKNRRSC